MKRVFLIEKPNFSFESAREHGQVKFLFNKAHSPRMAHLPGMVKTRLMEEKFDPEVDVIALTGRLSMVSILVAVASQFSDSVNLLLFNEGDGSYSERTISNGRSKIDRTSIPNESANAGVSIGSGPAD